MLEIMINDLAKCFHFGKFKMCAFIVHIYVSECAKVFEKKAFDYLNNYLDLMWRIILSHELFSWALILIWIFVFSFSENIYNDRTYGFESRGENTKN
jgi:hypothetical protein